MGRPIYNYELSDPDFSWLINNFKETHPEYSLIESSGLPLVFVSSAIEAKPVELDQANNEYEVLPPTDSKKANNLNENK